MKLRKNSILLCGLMLILVACGGGNNEAENASPAGANENVANAGNTTSNSNDNSAEDTVAVPESDPTADMPDLGNCQNVYYPIDEDKLYTYQNSSDVETIVQTIGFADVSPEGFTSVLNLDGLYSELHWDCSAEGMVSADYAQFSLFPGAEIDVVTVDSSGIVIPAEENMVIGYEWDSVFIMQVTINMEGLSTVADVTIDQHLEIVGIEPVSVPAGDYPEALLVHMTLNMAVNMGEGVGIETISTGTAYYVAGVGLVKQTGEFEGYSTVMELLSYE